MSNKIHKNDDMEISSDDEEPPTEEEIKAAATKLSKRLDMSTTTFKKFNRLLCDDLDMEDLTPAKGIVKKVYHDATAEHAGDKANDLPTDSEIVKAATKLAASSRVDLDEITNAKFLRMLSKRMAVDLTMKKKLVHSTLKQCRVEYYRGGSPPTSAPSPIVETSPRLQAEEDLSVTEKSTTEKSITECYSVPGSMPDADAVMVDHCGLEAPKSVVEKPRKSADLEVGFKVPEASELSWTDDFFDADTDGLVAVFDYDYKTLMQFRMKIYILTWLLPMTVGWLLIMIFIIAFAASGDTWETSPPVTYDPWETSPPVTYDPWETIPPETYDPWETIPPETYPPWETIPPETYPEPSHAATVIVIVVFLLIAVVFDVLGIYGTIRLIRSDIYAHHVAVVYDGIQCVMDTHLESNFPILAALQVFDAWLIVSKQSELIPFDQTTKLTVKAGGEVYTDICCCYWFCCGPCCLRIPFDTMALDTPSSDPKYYEKVMFGLSEPHKLQKLWGGMKRYLHDHVALVVGREAKSSAQETNANLSFMANLMMQQHMHQFGSAPALHSPVPSVVGTAPMSASMSASSPSTRTSCTSPPKTM